MRQVLHPPGPAEGGVTPRVRDEDTQLLDSLQNAEALRVLSSSDIIGSKPWVRCFRATRVELVAAW